MANNTGRSIDHSGIAKGAAVGRRRILAIGGLCLTMAMLSLAPASHAKGMEHTAKYWKGKYISQAVKKLGQPTQTTPLQGSGGNMYIFAHPNETHWVFETEPSGKIVKAARIE